MEGNLAAVQRIMLAFAEETGLQGGAPPRRYLWTDAFAVCNFVELYRQTAEERWLDLAVGLVDQVHHVLGRHRADSGRSGWISGASEEEGARHPTRGGLRIGKPLAERAPHEPPDERLEWERDGQYFHYLTKWMHALNRVSQATADRGYLVWGVELALAAHRGFLHAPSRGSKQLYWKMSIDLSRPLVPSMGLHDPLDGLVTCCELQSASRSRRLRAPPQREAGGEEGGVPEQSPADLSAELNPQIEELLEICQGRSWDTDDLLGIGGLLCDAWRMAQLMERGDFVAHDFLARVLRSALRGIGEVRGMLDLPNNYRLPFRDLGFSIGIHAAERLAAREKEVAREVSAQDLARMGNYHFLARKVEEHWLEERNQKSESWQEHRDINMVMLATSLAPEEFLRV